MTLGSQKLVITNAINLNKTYDKPVRNLIKNKFEVNLWKLYCSSEYFII